MHFIISPAKKMKVENHSFDYEELPEFLPKTKVILEELRSKSPEMLQKLWQCNDSIAQVNFQRIEEMDLEKNLSPALLSYQGIQYQYMAPDVFETKQFNYIQEHLRILSGFYGTLKPFDGVTPYRLEMATKLSLSGGKNLYDFWGDALAKELTANCDCLINLASKEYSKAVIPHLPPNFPCVTLVFGEEIQGKVKEKATMCKMARGSMMRWVAEEGIETAQNLKEFKQLDFEFSSSLSQENQYIFLKKEKNSDFL